MVYRVDHHSGGRRRGLYTVQHSAGAYMTSLTLSLVFGGGLGSTND